MERWKEIEHFPKYSVSNYGQIQKVSTGRILMHSVNQYGVVCVGLMRDGQQFHRSVPKLVACAFLDRPRGLVAFDTPINMDGDRRNNHVENLAWRPRWFAVKYNRQFRYRYDAPINAPIQEPATGEVWADSFECAMANGLLEKDVVLSILNHTVTWPTYQEFVVF